MGVVDYDFVRKIPILGYLRNRKYPLEQGEIEKFLDFILRAGNEILKIVENKIK